MASFGYHSVSIVSLFLFISLYLSSPFPELSFPLSTFLVNSFSLLVTILKRPPSPDARFLPLFPSFVVDCFYLKPEICEIILQNHRNLLCITITNCLLYFIGHTMRGMAMSLVNRPFLTAESLYGETNAMEDSKCDTQVLINKRILAMHDRFAGLFIESDPLRSLLFEVVLLLLRSGSMFELRFAVCLEKRCSFCSSF